MKITIINGPNLNLLGTRETDIYGVETFEVFLNKMEKLYPKIDFKYFQSNIEGELITALQLANIDESDGVILNPAGYTHTSVAIGDAIASIEVPVIEVHISNIMGREEFRKFSHVSGKAVGTIAGLGFKGYELAVQYFLEPQV